MSPELCSPGQLDEDCDGEIDEGCECIDGEAQACGAESSGLRTCAADAWGACVCIGEQVLDVDRNGVADATETLVGNGFFSANLNGWDNNFDPPYTQFVAADAGGLACSGALELMTLETVTPVGTGRFNWTTNFVQRCVSSSVSSVAVFFQARLLMNTGDYNGSLETLGVDPSVVGLDLAAFEAADCGGEPLAEQNQLIELSTDGSWQLLDGALVGGAATQSWRVALRVVGDDIEGEQSTGVRLMQFDNVLLRPLD